MDISLAELSLDNVGDGALRDRFREILTEQVVEMVRAPQKFQQSSGTLKAVITAKVEITYDPETRQADVHGGATVKMPALVEPSTAVYVRSGEFLVEEDPPEQLALPGGPPEIGDTEGGEQ